MSQLCSMVDISRQAFYKYRHTVTQIELCEAIIVQLVKEIRQCQPRIGGRKLYHLLQQDLQQLPVSYGRDKFFHLLKKHHLLVKRAKNYTVTTNSHHRFYIHTNLLKDRVITQPNEVVVSDITYLRLSTKFCYLFLVTDVYSRKILGYHLSRHLDVEGALVAAEMALSGKSPGDEMIHHSDRGV